MASDHGFDPARPATWTWEGLNAWVLDDDRTEVELEWALGCEREATHPPRKAYCRRLQSRINRLRSRAALARLEKEV